MRVLVCGSRHLKDYKVLKETLDELMPLPGFLDYFIISGGARGADSMAEDYAIEEDIPYQIFRANWEKHGKAAGPIRNKQMLDEGKPDLVVAFMAPDSRGTKNMVEQATKAGIEIKIVHIGSEKPVDAF